MQWVTLGALSGLILLWLAPVSAQETVVPSANLAGNLSADFYPMSGCQKPDKPSLPRPNYDDRPGVAAYNKAARGYNSQSKAFDACINGYVDKAPNDIDWIMFTVNKAVARANGLSPPAPPTESGNMPSGFYPSPDCIMPDAQLGATPDEHDTKAMETHNTGVRTFNVLARGFNECIKAYAVRAQVDIERIEQAEKEAALQASGQ